MQKTAKFQPIPNSREAFFERDKVADLYDSTVWDDSKREVVWRWQETSFGLRLAFRLRGMQHVEYVALSRTLPKEPVANPVIQLFQLSRDSKAGDLKITAGSHFFFVIGGADATEVTEAIEAEETDDVLRSLKVGRDQHDGVRVV